MAKVKAVPEGFHTVTPALTVSGATKAIEFYKRAFGAEERFRAPGPDGKIMHAELKIGDSIIFVHDEVMGARSPQTLGGTSGGLYLYVDNADALFKRAVDAGAKVLMPVADAFWGDRHGRVADPFGHEWSISTHIKDMTPQEIEKAQAEFFAKMQEQK